MSTIPELRLCSKCGIAKPRSEFTKQPGSADGLKRRCKACIRDYNAAYREANRDYYLEYCRTWQAEHVDHVREYRREYSQKNVERRRQNFRSWVERNRERMRELGRRRDPDKRRLSVRTWQRNHPDRKQAIDRAYRLANPLAKRVNEHRRQARKRGNGGSFTTMEWRALCGWFGGVCLSCGNSELTVDHVVPIHMGGRNSIENLQPLCRSCNSSKGTRTIDYRNPVRLAEFLEHRND